MERSYKSESDRIFFSAYAIPDEIEFVPKQPKYLPKRTWVPWKDTSIKQPLVTKPDPFLTREVPEKKPRSESLEDSKFMRGIALDQQNRLERERIKKEYAAKPKWLPRIGPPKKT